MPKLTAKQLTAIADDFTNIAAEISNYIIYHQLSIKGRLGKIHFAILEEAEKLYTLSAIQVGDETEAALQELNDITTSILESYQHLKDIKQAMSLAVAALDVVTAITTGKLNAIVDTVRALGKEAGLSKEEEEE